MMGPKNDTQFYFIFQRIELWPLDSVNTVLVPTTWNPFYKSFLEAEILY